MRRWVGLGWVMAIAGLSLGGNCNVVRAQSLVLDGTVGPGLTLQGPAYEIPQALGTTVEQNLFHSFSVFGLLAGESANFQAAPEVRNIFTRVTGGAASEIDGLVSVTGSDANLFLLNPAGIVFGPEGQLNIGGSFLGTAAGAVVFGDRGEFSAVELGAADLLTVSPSALRFAAAQGQIVSRSVASAGMNAFRGELFGLRVAEGRSLSLLGGDVVVDGGNDTDPGRVLAGGLNAPGGRIEMGGLAEAGEIALTVNDAGIVAEFPTDAALADVSLVNNARVDVRGNGGGDIAVSADQFLARDGGRLNAGTEGDRPGGDIAVSATEVLVSGSVGASERSGFYSYAFDEGDGGAIRVTVDRLQMEDRAVIFSDSFAQGNAGAIAIAADEVTLTDAFIISSALAEGNGGDVTVTGDRLRLSAALIGGDVYAEGNSGDVTLDFKDSIILDDQSSISSIIREGAEGGTSGQLMIRTGRLEALRGAQISNGISGRGNTQDLVIEAEEILFRDRVDNDAGGFASSGIFSPIDMGGQGSIGTIRIQTGSLQLLDGAQIQTLIRGNGNGGEIQIFASEFIKLETPTSKISTSISSGAIGEPGDIKITSPSVSLHEAAAITSAIFGEGKAGNIEINADSLVLSEVATVSPELSWSGRIETTSGSLGDAGNLLINAKQVSIKGGYLSAGVVESSGPESVTLELSGRGKGGDIQINAENLDIQDGSLIGVNNFGIGQSGSITFRVTDSFSLSSSGIDSTASNIINPGKAGPIQIEAKNIQIIDSTILSSTQSQGNAAPLALRALENIRVEGDESLLVSAVIDAESGGDGGDILLEAENVILGQGVSLSSQTVGLGNAGNIQVNAGDRLSIGPQVLLSTTTNSRGRAGSVELNAPTVTLESDARLSTLTSGSGDAGDIRVQANEQVSLLDGAQFVTSTEGLGNAGTIAIQTNDLEIQGTSELGRSSGLFSRAEGNAQGRAGDIEIQAQSTVIADLSLISASSLTAANQPASDVSITGDRLILDQSGIFTASNSGDGGNLRFNLSKAVLLSNGSLLETTAGQSGTDGNGGNIAITTPILIGLPSNNSDIIANAFSGSGGNITISADAILNFDLANGQTSEQLRSNRTNDISASSQLGTSGTLNLTGFNTDPSQGSVQLPQTLSDPSNQISRRCAPETIAANQLILTGRSGIPQSPSEPLTANAPQPPWLPLPATQSSQNQTAAEKPLLPQHHPQKAAPLEATRWQQSPQGTVTLLAEQPVAAIASNCIENAIGKASPAQPVSNLP